MIGKPEWFTYRIFGWGIRPKKWQGWVYVAIAAAAIGFTMSAAITSALKPWIFGIVMGIFILDVLDIMMKLPKMHDERENLQQLIIERNCSFAAIGAIIAIALWQAAQNSAAIAAEKITFDISLLYALGAMFVAKTTSTIYVKVKM